MLVQRVNWIRALRIISIIWGSVIRSGGESCKNYAATTNLLGVGFVCFFFLKPCLRDLVVSPGQMLPPSDIKDMLNLYGDICFT